MEGREYLRRIAMTTRTSSAFVSAGILRAQKPAVATIAGGATCQKDRVSWYSQSARDGGCGGIVARKMPALRNTQGEQRRPSNNLRASRRYFAAQRTSGVKNSVAPRTNKITANPRRIFAAGSCTAILLPINPPIT